MHPEDRCYSARLRSSSRRFGLQSLDELPSVNPEQIEHFKEEAEDEAQMTLNI